MKDHYSESNQQKENISIGPANQRAGDGKNNERRSVSQSLRYDVQTLLDLRGNSTAVKPPDPAIQELLNDATITTKPHHAVLQDKSPNSSRRTRARRGLPKSQWGNVPDNKLNVDNRNSKRNLTSTDSKENAAAEKTSIAVKSESFNDKPTITHSNEPPGDTVSTEGKSKSNVPQKNTKNKTSNPGNDEKKHPRRNNKRHSSAQQDTQAQTQGFTGLLPPSTPIGYPPLFGMYNPAAPQMIVPNLAALYGMPIAANSHYSMNGNENPVAQHTEQHQIPQSAPVISFASPAMPEVVSPQLLEACTAEFKRVSQQIADLDRYMALRTFAMEPGTKKMLVEQRVDLVKKLDRARWMKEIVEGQLQVLEESKNAGDSAEGSCQTGIPSQNGWNFTQCDVPSVVPPVSRSEPTTIKDRHHPAQDEKGNGSFTSNGIVHSHSNPGTDTAKTWHAVTNGRRGVEQDALRQKPMLDVPDEIKDLHRKLENAIEAKDDADVNPILEELSNRIRDLKIGGIKEREQVKTKGNDNQDSTDKEPLSDSSTKGNIVGARQSQASPGRISPSGSDGKSESTTALSKIDAYGTTTKPAKRDGSDETKSEQSAEDGMSDDGSSSRWCEQESTPRVLDTLLNWFRSKPTIKG